MQAVMTCLAAQAVPADSALTIDKSDAARVNCYWYISKANRISLEMLLLVKTSIQDVAEDWDRTKRITTDSQSPDLTRCS